MSEFCYDCIREYEPEISPKLNGLRHKQRGELLFDVCEGCGEGWFDWEGKRVATVATQKKGGENEPRTQRRE